MNNFLWIANLRIGKRLALGFSLLIALMLGLTAIGMNRVAKINGSLSSIGDLNSVRRLAGRSAEAAKEIKGLISTSVDRVEQGSALVDKAGMTMTEVVSSIRRVTDIVAEISAANGEQASGVAQVGEAITQIDQATQQNAALVSQMAAAANGMREQSQRLVEAVGVFRLGNEERPTLAIGFT